MAFAASSSSTHVLYTAVYTKDSDLYRKMNAALGDYGDEADPPGIEVAVTLLKPLPPVLAALLACCAATAQFISSSLHFLVNFTKRLYFYENLRARRRFKLFQLFLSFSIIKRSLSLSRK